MKNGDLVLVSTVGGDFAVVIIDFDTRSKGRDIYLQFLDDGRCDWIMKCRCEPAYWTFHGPMTAGGSP